METPKNKSRRGRGRPKTFNDDQANTASEESPESPQDSSSENLESDDGDNISFTPRPRDVPHNSSSPPQGVALAPQTRRAPIEWPPSLARKMRYLVKLIEMTRAERDQEAKERQLLLDRNSMLEDEKTRITSDLEELKAERMSEAMEMQRLSYENQLLKEQVAHRNALVKQLQEIFNTFKDPVLHIDDLDLAAE